MPVYLSQCGGRLGDPPIPKPPRWRLSITPAAPNGAAGALSGRIIQTLHLVGVELEKVGDDFGFGRVGRKVVGGGAVIP